MPHSAPEIVFSAPPVSVPAPHLELVLLARDQAPVLDAVAAAVVAHLDAFLAEPWSLTLVDHASLDATAAAVAVAAVRLSARDRAGCRAPAGGDVSSMRLDDRLDQKGLRARFASSTAAVVAFVRIDTVNDVARVLAPITGSTTRAVAPVLEIAPGSLPVAVLAPARRLVGRRGALVTIGGVGLTAVLAACGRRSSSDASSSSTTAPSAPVTSAAPAASSSGDPAAILAGGAAALAPEMTEGPYYLDLNLVRSNVVEDRKGAALALDLLVVDAQGAPIPGAVVDIWHCDAEGNYSGFVATSATANGGGAGPGGPPPSGGAGGPAGGPPPGGGGGAGGPGAATPTDASTFLRGTQLADAAGKVGFATIYPGWYQGRTVHIHVKVHAGGKQIHTGQLFLDDTFTDGVYAAEAPYSARPVRSLRNAGDGIFAGGGAQSVLAVAKAAGGYAATMTMAVKTA